MGWQAPRFRIVEKGLRIKKKLKPFMRGVDVEGGLTVFGSTQAAARRRVADPAIMLRGTLHWSAPACYGSGDTARDAAVGSMSTVPSWLADLKNLVRHA